MTQEMLHVIEMQQTNVNVLVVKPEADENNKTSYRRCNCSWASGGSYVKSSLGCWNIEIKLEISWKVKLGWYQS